MEKIKLVCFDIDGTLVDGISWKILAQGLGCLPQEEYINIFQRCQKGEITFSKGEELLKKLYQSSGNANKPFIKDLFDNIEVRKEAGDLISYLREKGYKIYFISGAIDIYVESIAKKLDADGFYANSTLEFDSNGNLQKINYRDNQGEVKVEQLTSLIQNLGINMDEVAFIGDSDNDIEVFKVTKHGIAVHSFDEELKKVSWRIVNSLPEIKDIL